jgi:tRNA(fMet)-specific endonuclease VapC
MIIDTNAISALADGHKQIVNLLKQELVLHIPVVVLGEYRYGLKRSRERVQREQWLLDLESCSKILDIDLDTTHFYANIREDLRITGKPIPENDIWISALAIQHELKVVTQDTHFDFVRGLKRLSW